MPPHAGAVLDMGYVVIRLPSHLNHLRGHHQCIWAVLLARLGVTHAQWAATQSQYYMPRFRGQAVMEASWVQQGLRLPVPVDPVGARRPPSLAPACYLDRVADGVRARPLRHGVGLYRRRWPLAVLLLLRTADAGSSELITVGRVIKKCLRSLHTVPIS